MSGKFDRGTQIKFCMPCVFKANPSATSPGKMVLSTKGHIRRSHSYPMEYLAQTRAKLPSILIPRHAVSRRRYRDSERNM
jgi:hypothetical protein